MAKQGSTLAGVMDAFATAVSISLQYGVPLEDLCNKFSHMRFEPSGFTNNRQIPIAKSIVDYIFRYLSVKFIGQADGAGHAIEVEDTAVDNLQASADTPLVGETVETFMDQAEGTKKTTESSFQNQADAPACSNCGSITVRSGACYSCPNCGSTSGCG